MLVSACVLPLVLFSAVLLLRNIAADAEQTGRLVLNRARLLAEDVDREVARTIAAAEVLSTDDNLARGDFEAFHRRAMQVRHQLETNVVVRDRSGQQVVNTRVPWGMALPRTPSYEVDERVIGTRRPQVSGLLGGDAAQAPLLAVVVPLLRDGEVRHLLSLTIAPERLQAVIASDRQPPGWAVGVADGDGVMIARSRRPEEFVGSRLPPAVWERVRTAPEGIHRVPDLEGNPTLQAYGRSESSGWVIGVSVPEALVAAPARQALLLFTAGGLALFLLGVAGAYRLSRRLTGPVVHLTAAAKALGTGEAIPPQDGGVVELDAVDAAIRDAAPLIQQRAIALQESESRYRAIVETAVDAMVVIDDGGIIQAFNPAAERLFGCTAEAVVGRNIRTLMPEPYASEHDSYLRNYRRTGVRKIIGIGREIMGRRQDGSTFPAELAVTEWHAGGRRYYTGIMRDVSERRRAEDALRASKVEADRANLAKSKFLAAASHDLRQPVQALVLFQATLAERLAGHAAEPLVESMGQALGSLHMLLDSLLDVSRLDAGLIVAHPEEVPLMAVIERLAAEYLPQAGAKRLRLRVACTGMVVRSDPVLLERILRNLIENALRYTERGGVLLGCRRCGDRLRVEVWDTGVGIEPDKQADIFEEFFQVGNVERDRSKGLGLGLAVVRRLARLLGHEVTVRSVPGKGSVFALDMPVVVAAADAQPAKVESARPRDGLILVIDDEPLVRLGLQAMLEGWGYRVLSAGSVEEAVRHIESGAWPHAILADYRLRGGETGLDAIRAIHGRLNTAVPATVITGDTAPERLVEVREGGYALLHKPVAAHELRATVGEMLRAAE
ncbi:PAS domain S-box protein [Azospirillum sp. TSO22-1]|uniref:hybrid sensor histidine kinase/response regulator n=1 Tax=Azospirillum sp. TSO22-1 TaxID=716789 RepID=UPI001FFF9807|nr:PAS domain S-box protein [Azospirillum sp. TSO22-1]